MRVNRSIVLCIATAFISSAACEFHERERSGGGVQAEVGGSGAVAVDVEPDPAQRVYVYDEGYPPGTYLYNNYYYYEGHRYAHDDFVNRFVQENIRQHRYVNSDDNRRQGMPIEQRQRSDFAKNHGARQDSGARPSERASEQAPVRQQEAPVRHEETPSANVERTENRPPTNQERGAEIRQPENRAAGSEEHRANVDRPENKKGTAKDERKPGSEEPRREEPK